MNNLSSHILFCELVCWNPHGVKQIERLLLLPSIKRDVLFHRDQHKSHTLHEIAFVANFSASSIWMYSDLKSASDANFCSSSWLASPGWHYHLTYIREQENIFKSIFLCDMQLNLKSELSKKDDEKISFCNFPFVWFECQMQMSYLFFFLISSEIRK